MVAMSVSLLDQVPLWLLARVEPSGPYTVAFRVGRTVSARESS